MNVNVYNCNTLFVSAYYDLNNSPENKAFRLQQLEKLVALQIPLVLFCDESIYEAMKHYQSPYVHLVKQDLHTIQTYNLCTSQPFELPPYRNVEKDNQIFMAFMNSKIDFLHEASLLYPKKQNYVWVDAALMKIIQDPNAMKERLHDLQTYSQPKILFPGYATSTPIHELFQKVLWRFLGGFLVVPKTLLPRFRSECDILLQSCMCVKKLTWEVNIWAYVEYKHPELFHYYFGDHNDSIVKWSV